jgi:hypothetical protein
VSKEPSITGFLSSGHSPAVVNRHDIVRGDIDKDDFNRYFREASQPSVSRLPGVSPTRKGKNGFRRSPVSLAPSMPQYSQDLDLFEKRLSTILNSICDMIDKSQRRITGDDDMDHLNQEWQNVAVSMDRLLLTIFLVVVSTVFLLLLANVSNES